MCKVKTEDTAFGCAFMLTLVVSNSKCKTNESQIKKKQMPDKAFR